MSVYLFFFGNQWKGKEIKTPQKGVKSFLLILELLTVNF